jgi:hypothetical protein
MLRRSDGGSAEDRFESVPPAADTLPQLAPFGALAETGVDLRSTRLAGAFDSAQNLSPGEYSFVMQSLVSHCLLPF